MVVDPGLRNRLQPRGLCLDRGEPPHARFRVVGTLESISAIGTQKAGNRDRWRPMISLSGLGDTRLCD